ncbi:MAG: helix-turn-helix domain-containing protein [Bradyrhizobium sp.]
MSKYISVQTRSIDSFKEIDDSIRGAHIETVQLERGRLRGHMTHMSVGGLPVATGAFSVGLRARGVLSDDRVTIAVLTGATSRVTQWSYETHPADVLVTPAGVDHDARFYGGASYAVISLDQADLDGAFATEPRLRELGTSPKRHFRADKHGGEYVIRRLRDIIARLAAPNVRWNADAAEFWKQSIIETMTMTILASTPSELDGSLLSAKRIVRKVEDYIEAAGLRPIHISELCREVHVSRRTLHRAFYDAVGIGPVAFLRCRRLCSVHSTLRDSDPATTTIADVATQHGFLNVGRFSGYYRSLFDECPSRTLAGFDCPTNRCGDCPQTQRTFADSAEISPDQQVAMPIAAPEPS